MMLLTFLAERVTPERPAFEQLEQLLQAHVRHLAQTMLSLVHLALPASDMSAGYPAIESASGSTVGVVVPSPPPESDENDDNRERAKRGGDIDL